MFSQQESFSETVLHIWSGILWRWSHGLYRSFHTP